MNTMGLNEPEKRFFTVEYNLTDEKVSDITFFVNREDAQKWMDFVLNRDGVCFIYPGRIANFTYDDKDYTIEIRER